MKKYLQKLYLISIFLLLPVKSVFAIDNFNGKLNKQNVLESSNQAITSFENIISGNSKLLPTPMGIAGKWSEFGKSVVLDGNRALIGLPGAQEHGVVYVFDYIDENWIKSSVLKSNDINPNNEFGLSVALFGNRAVVGETYRTCID